MTIIYCFQALPLRATHGRFCTLLCWVLIGLFFCVLATPTTAQPFRISALVISNGTVAVSFPTRSDSYYLLQASPRLNNSSTPVDAILGSGGTNGFNPASS